MKRFFALATVVLAVWAGRVPGLKAAESLRVLIYAGPGNGAEAQSWANFLNQRQAKAEAAETAPTEEQLGRADALVVFQNDLTPSLEGSRPALDAFAKRGGAFLVIHGGVAAGGASWWKPLIGGAWVPESSRKFMSRMMLYPAGDGSPVTRGASPFDLDDETLYDLDLEKGIEVAGSAFTPKSGRGRSQPKSAGASSAAERVNIYDLQPQMWGYEAAGGEGTKAHRAFVALQGSPSTRKHTSYRVFLLRGLAWAAGRGNADEFCTAEELAALRYPEGGAETGEKTAAQMEIQPGFHVKVVAEEPLIDKPIAVQWDGSGRLWVAETPEYPNGRRTTVAPTWKETASLVPGITNRPAHDRISILSEPDANGKFTKKQVFYEGLELVTGFCLYRDGVIAIHEPDIVFLRDTDGDGKADKVERLFTGFKPGDTHFVANHFIAAPDGWIYASMGGDAEVKSPDGKRSFGRVSSGMFRFKPDGSAIEQFASKGGNSFGAEITSDGEAYFGQATTGSPLQHVVLPERVIARGGGGEGTAPKSVIDQRPVIRRTMPDRAPLMQIDVVGGYSAACAALIYEGGTWPDGWEGSAFVTEPILNIIHNESVRSAGATFTGVMTRTAAEFIYSPDYWFRPIECALGPDGGVYILDFYSPVIAHSDSRGPQHSRSGASVRPDRDHYFGRIYRLQNNEARAREIPDLAKAGVAGLVEALSHPNRTVRFNAQRLLVESGSPQVIAALQSVAAGAKFAPARILALWTLERLNALPRETLAAAFRDSEASVRKSAALVVEAAGAGSWQKELAGLLADGDARVRITALRALASAEIAPETADAVAAVWPQLDDAWSRTAATAVLAGDPAGGILAALRSAKAGSTGKLVDALARRVARESNPQAVASLIIRLADSSALDDAARARVLERLAEAKPGEETPELDAALGKLLRSDAEQTRFAALPLAAAWDKSGKLRAEVDALATPLLALALDGQKPSGERVRAVTSLMGLRGSRPEILPALEKILTREGENEEVRSRVIVELGASGDAGAGAALIAAFNQLSRGEQDLAFNAVVTRSDWALLFLGAMEKKEISLATIGPANSHRLRTHPARAVAERAATVLDGLLAPSPDKDALIAKLTPAVKLPGNAAKGKELFTTTCAVCHKFGDNGADVGPVLTGMGAHGPEMLLVHILDPNRQVDSGFEAWNVETKDGEFHTGIIAEQNNERIVMKAPGQRLEIPKATIKSRVNTHRSLMPEGFEALGGDALRDIIAYLTADVSRFRVLDLTAAFTADTRHGLYASREAERDTLHFAKFGMVSVDGVPFEVVNPANSASGGNVIVLRGGGGGTFADTMPRRVEVKAGVAARRFYFLGGVAGWGAGEAHEGDVIMKVGIVYEDGSRDTVSLRNGVHFSDYVGRIDVPGSRFADGVVTDKQIRWFAIEVPKKAVVAKLVLETPGGTPAATTVAITADLEEKPAAGVPKFGEAAPHDPPVPLEWGAGRRILVVGGGSSHDFKKWFDTADTAMLRAMGGFSVNYTESAEVTARELPKADVVVLSTNQRGFDTPELRAALMEYVNAGKGLVLLHPGVWYNWNWKEYNAGLVGGGARGHDRLGEFGVRVLKEHPVTRGVTGSFKVTDELYLMMEDPAGAGIEVLAETSPALATKKSHPSVWVVKHPKARIVGIALGHDGRVHELTEYKALLVNAVNWVGGK